MSTIKIKPKPEILYDEAVNPKSVLLNYQAYAEIIEILEDFECDEVIQQRLNEPDLPFPENPNEL